MTDPNVYAVHRSWDRKYPVIVRAEGIYLYDSQGRRYIDGSGGSSVVTSIGHGVREVTQTMQAQANAFSFYPAHAFTNQPYLDLCEQIVHLAPGSMRDNSRVWLACTGTDANDDAVRLARQYWVERGQASKYQVLGRWQGFHGNNIAAAGFSGITGRRKIFQPMFVDSPHIPPAFCYRCPFEKTFPECRLLCARSLESLIRQLGPENIAAFIAEPVVGAALGCAPAPDGYFQLIREICDRYEILWIADEVMTGWGRTGKMWGVEHWNVTPDIITSAKGITSGYTPLSAVIARDEIWATLQKNHSPFKAGHTLNANPVSSAGALAVIRYILEHHLTENARERGLQALAGLREIARRHPILGDVRGLGMMFGFEYVQERTGKTPFPPERKVSYLFEKTALNHGLVTYPCSGSIDGVLGDMTLMAPPLITSEVEMDEILAIIDKSLEEVEDELRVQ
jgi:adenosylmethionine-8-amino-7-oxononanoate aminotransferase